MKTEDEGNHEEHEDHEGHEEKKRVEHPLGSKPSDDLVAGFAAPCGMRLPSPLSPETETIVSQTIGAAIAVHRALGPGLLESLYHRAMCVELTATGLPFECERSIRTQYRGIDLPGQRIDLIVGNAVVVELKSVLRLDEIHRAQLISYMRVARLRAGLLINFRVPSLRRGLRRVVL